MAIRQRFFYDRICAPLVVLISQLTATTLVHSFSSLSSPLLSPSSSLFRESKSSALFMARTRGLEVRPESATPMEGGMTLYLKAGPDGKSVGDCPFAQFVRMVLEEKGLEYAVQPCVQETKPKWLIEHYEGKMPALRHRKECYVESDVIAEYLDFFFAEPPLKGSKKEMEDAEEAIAGFFPAVARYLKHTPDGDEEDAELKENLNGVLNKLEAHLTKEEAAGGRVGPYLAGNGEKVTVLDCGLAPKLYHMQTGLEAFKDNAIDLGQQYPAVQKYVDAIFSRESFKKTTYPKEMITWGWGNARN